MHYKYVAMKQFTWDCIIACASRKETLKIMTWNKILDYYIDNFVIVQTE